MYYVYIMTNRSRTLYTGVTNNLERRVSEHKTKSTPGFTQKYCIDTLIYYEEYTDIRAAIDRETTIKGLTRIKKIRMIEEFNPEWKEIPIIQCY
jgi:putative endonuclease